MKTFGTFAAAIAAGLTLSACDGGTIHKTSRLGDIDVLSVDARQRLVLTGTNHRGERIVCAEPSPDAIVAQAAALAASGNFTAPQGPSGGGGLSASLSESAASIAMRTQTIQLMRDGYYRMCEALLNGQLDSNQYRLTMLQIDLFLVTILALEALGGTVIATPPVIIGADAKAIAGKETVDSSASADTPAVAIGEIKVTGTPPDPARAKAIEAIVKYYIAKSQSFRLQFIPNGT